jgi:peptide-methionine (S)-S-oxide reductase
MDGVVRTRVGYAGGTTPGPTYRDIGDHSEAVEVVYDPRAVSYRDLLEVFFATHAPTRPPYSVQYRSAIFYRTESEREAAEEAIARAAATVGRVYTAVEPYSSFHSAEGYHQKHALRRYADLMGEFRRLHPHERDFVDSTAVARVNGWLDGCATHEQLDRELARTGLSAAAQAAVRARAVPAGGARTGCRVQA